MQAKILGVISHLVKKFKKKEDFQEKVGNFSNTGLKLQMLRFMQNFIACLVVCIFLKYYFSSKKGVFC
jgi:hypothetical protein